MSGSKHFNKIAIAITALTLVITLLFMNGAAFGIEISAGAMGYETRLFDNSRVHTIDIVMDNFDEFIANAASEEYYSAAVVIDGEAYKNVAIRGKGNTSLSNVASMDSDRYSFKIEFDHYDSSITYHGLDKLSLNNLIQDSTMMKDYLTYTMMGEFGTAAPLCSFVYITVNGEDWGLYLAVEAIEDSFLKRNYGANYGELYKPDSMSFGGGRGNGKDFNMDDFMNREDFENSEQSVTMPDMNGFDPSQIKGDMPQMPDMGNFDPSQLEGTFGGFGEQMPDMPRENTTESSKNQKFVENKGGFGGGFGMGSSDVKLQYIDDNADSYQNIWNNAKTDVSDADKTRLIESLRKLSKVEELESVVDIEAVIRYFVVHNYVCNGDSYTGSMIHNYYLYEENGKLSMLPWDYNLAFGTFQGGNAQSTVNTPIDSPISGGAGEDRPMWSWILSDEAYTELYHQYFSKFINTVNTAGIIDNAYNIIKPYVEKDPTAFYTYEEFEAGVKTLRQFCTLRSESISMQLESGETVNNMSYVDASGINLSDMGSMGGGKGGFDRGDRENMPDTSVRGDFNGVRPQSPQTSDEISTNENLGAPSEGSREPVTSTISQNASNGDITPLESENAAPQPDRTTRPSSDSSRQPMGEMPFSTSMGEAQTDDNSALILLGVSVLILAAGLVIAKLYKY